MVRRARLPRRSGFLPVLAGTRFTKCLWDNFRSRDKAFQRRRVDARLSLLQKFQYQVRTRTSIPKSVPTCCRKLVKLAKLLSEFRK